MELLTEGSEAKTTVWDNAPKWAIAHYYNSKGIGYYFGLEIAYKRFIYRKTVSGHILPDELKKNWRKTLVIRQIQP